MSSESAVVSQHWCIKSSSFVTTRERGTTWVNSIGYGAWVAPLVCEKISKSTLYEFAQEARIPGRKNSKHWRRFRKVVIDRWLERMPGIRSPHRSEKDS